MKPDIIVTWPDNCDYPLWRRFIKCNRDVFDQVIIVLMKTNSEHNFSDFIKMTMQDCTVVDSPKLSRNQDWRNIAINHALKLSKSDWVWFTEQDFLLKVGFWEQVNKNILEGCLVISYYDQFRMHPCCIFAKREIIEKTRKDFGIVPNVSDHFSLFQQDIDELFYNGDLVIGSIENHCEHLNGLSSNFYLISIGQKPNYKPERFKQYIKDTLCSGVEMDNDYIKICKEYLK